MWRVLLLALLIGVMLAGCGSEPVQWTTEQKTEVAQKWAATALAANVFTTGDTTAKYAFFGLCMKDTVVARYDYAAWKATETAIVDALFADGTVQSCITQGNAL